MRIDVITVFPGYLAPLRESLIGKAIADGIIDLAVHDLRAWTTDRHHSVDDTPYGGGPGMVMRADVWGRALRAVVGGAAVTGSPKSVTDGGPVTESPGSGIDGGPVTESPGSGIDGGPVTESSRPGTVLVIPTPSGQRFTQAVARELAGSDHLVFACGRYEGIDARVAEDAAGSMTVRELSIGDYVLAGGEAAVLVMVEAIGRLLPGVLGNADSAADDSFSQGPDGAGPGLLEGPVYTRPAEYRGMSVPDVLLSGDHAAIARWRRDQALRRTAAHRPDLLASLTADQCDARDLEVLLELGATPPAGLAERVAAERAAREAKRRRRRNR